MKENGWAPHPGVGSRRTLAVGGRARDAGRRVVGLAAGHIISSRLRRRRRFGTRRRSQALGDGGAVGLLAGNPSYDKFTLANDDKFTHPERDSAGLVCRR